MALLANNGNLNHRSRLARKHSFCNNLAIYITQMLNGNFNFDEMWNTLCTVNGFLQSFGNFAAK